MRRLIACAGAAALVLLTAGSASAAEGNGNPLRNPDQWLRKHAYTYDFSTGDVTPSTNGSRINWTRQRSDSPLDHNARAVIAIIRNGEPGVNSDYADVYTRKSLSINKRTGDVNNLSYDEKSDTTGAGAPRISVEFNNGVVAYLASAYCSTPIAIDTSWSRADFTGATDACGFYDSNGDWYAADGVHSAWNALVQAHPFWRVTRTYMVFDEVGTYLVDRIALGTNRLYNYGDRRAVPCFGDEDVC